MSKNIYVIVSKRTGKPVTESARLPFFWYKKTAIDRCRQLINSEVKPINMDNINDLLGAGWKPIPSETKKAKQ